MSIATRLRTDETPESGPVPASVPGEFVIYLGPGRVPETLDIATTELLLTWLEWAEVELRFCELLEAEKCPCMARAEHLAGMKRWTGRDLNPWPPACKADDLPF